MSYEPRVVDGELRKRLLAMGAIVIEGPKACGKTETARRIAKSEVLLDVDLNAQQMMAVDPSLVLEGEAPRLIDEWQVEPSIWNHVRRMVDKRHQPGQFILTGSAVPSDDATRHTGAGRFTRLRMRPMTLFETGHTNGAISLKAVFDGEIPRSADPGLSVKDLAERVTMGGWPALQSYTLSAATLAVRDYIEEIRRVDVGRVANTRRDPSKVGRLLRALARNTATYASVATLAADTGGAEGPIDIHTAHDYIDALERLMIIENQPAWSPHLRSKSALRKAAKRHFIDPSIAVAALGARSDQLLNDLNLFGFLFESLVVRDLRVYTQDLDARVLQYRDNTGLEVDAIIETADGKWGAFEIKLGQGLIETAAENLKRFVNRVDTHKSGQPVILAVVVGSGYGYVRDDGIAVIPIGALKP